MSRIQLIRIAITKEAGVPDVKRSLDDQESNSNQVNLAESFQGFNLIATWACEGISVILDQLICLHACISILFTRIPFENRN